MNLSCNQPCVNNLAGAAVTADVKPNRRSRRGRRGGKKNKIAANAAGGQAAQQVDEGSTASRTQSMGHVLPLCTATRVE